MPSPAVTLVALTLAVVLAACGGGSDDIADEGSPSAPPPATSAAPTAAAPSETVTADGTPSAGGGELRPASPSTSGPSTSGPSTPAPSTPAPSTEAAGGQGEAGILLPAEESQSTEEKDPTTGLTLTFALDFVDLTGSQQRIPPQELPADSIVLEEHFEDRDAAVLRPFSDPPAEGLFGNFDDVFFYDMVVGQPDSIVTSPITGVPASDLVDVGLITASFSTNFQGAEDVSSGLFCWGGAGKGLSAADQSRYELRVQPDRRLVVDRINAGGQISARLLELELARPPDTATFARLLCRRGDGGEVQIGAGWTQGDEGESAWVADPDPLPAGGSAGILMRSGENPTSADTFISFVQLLIFDATAIDFGA
ncbi:hypothetical protein [Euzebya sp.]|uniref:hypothetical protein n=1 Tax=Euzebya sp. TaxID=1971409 RepID=UPI003511F211